MPIISFSQINGNYRYSIAARGFAAIRVPKIFNQESERYLNTTLNGGMIKFNDNEFSYRISGNFIDKALSFDNNCINCDLARGRLKDYAFKVGFEKNFSYSRLQPYFALDMGYRYNRFKGLVNTINNQRSIASVHDLEDTKSGGTAASAIGLKIHPVEYISIFIESGIEFYYAYVRQDVTAQDITASGKQIKFNRGEFLLNPLSIGIQIQLTNKN
ncbi:hypothetical protein [Pedobacter hartonius]|uniref:hypothetical protein n=1 Tax=Pedobacter hartonius TaxID=425514 RepID=UPI000B8964A1|nr:hypothetical protein [Pedobacter hartonius]